MQIKNTQVTRKILKLDNTQSQKLPSENDAIKLKKSSALEDDRVTITSSVSHPTRPKKLSNEYDLSSIYSNGAHPPRPKLSEAQQLFDNGGGHPDRPKK
ncbi:MAG: hypothetical protein GY928_20395 [Colwellia sp.]|nr:hypothetical protein [Colwellia sp.]